MPRGKYGLINDCFEICRENSIAAEFDTGQPSQSSYSIKQLRKNEESRSIVLTYRIRIAFGFVYRIRIEFGFTFKAIRFVYIL